MKTDTDKSPAEFFRKVEEDATVAFALRRLDTAFLRLGVAERKKAEALAVVMAPVREAVDAVNAAADAEIATLREEYDAATSAARAAVMETKQTALGTVMAVVYTPASVIADGLKLRDWAEKQPPVVKNAVLSYLKPKVAYTRIMPVAELPTAKGKASKEKE